MVINHMNQINGIKSYHVISYPIFMWYIFSISLCRGLSWLQKNGGAQGLGLPQILQVDLKKRCPHGDLGYSPWPRDLQPSSLPHLSPVGIRCKPRRRVRSTPTWPEPPVLAKNPLITWDRMVITIEKSWYIHVSWEYIYIYIMYVYVYIYNYIFRHIYILLIM
jgi:hypothetical protein